MTLVSKLSNLFNELSHRWRVHWRLFRGNLSPSQKVTVSGIWGLNLTQEHSLRGHRADCTPVPHTSVCKSKGSRKGKPICA